MNRCIEADANAGAILAMHSFKEDNNWSEPYDNAKSDWYFWSDNFNESLIGEFEEKAIDSDGKLDKAKEHL